MCERDAQPGCAGCCRSGCRQSGVGLSGFGVNSKSPPWTQPVLPPVMGHSPTLGSLRGSVLRRGALVLAKNQALSCLQPFTLKLSLTSRNGDPHVTFLPCFLAKPNAGELRSELSFLARSWDLVLATLPSNRFQAEQQCWGFLACLHFTSVGAHLGISPSHFRGSREHKRGHRP